MVRLTSLCRRLVVAVAVPIIALTAASPPLLGQQTRTSDDGQVDAVDMEVLMRGPVHEGFAEPMAESRGFLELPEPAPDPIEELPARARPTDDRRDATWIPGYWGIEGETDELVWISGTWRYAPPDMRWVPGYWATVDSGSVWVSGFWVDDTLERVEYLPPPPPVDDFSPTVEAPGDDYFWVPGNYVWTGERYVWEEGFWAEAQPHWAWTPARYVWTPRGYIYVAGYWDYPVERRGVLFAPVRLTTTYREVYRPQVAINVRRALVHWFVRPNYRHYYFGNYYGDRYRNIGFTPWVAYVERPTYYDPLYSYYRATRVDYLQTLVQAHRRIAVADRARLPVSYRQYQQLVTQSPQQVEAVQLTNFAQPVDRLIAGDGEQQFEELSDQAGGQMEQYREQIQSVRQFARGRLEAEADADVRQDQQDAAQRPQRDRTEGDRPQRDRTDGDRPQRDRTEGDRPQRDRTEGDRPQRDRTDGDRPQRDRTEGDRPQRDRTEGDRPQRDRTEGDRPQRDRTERPQRDRPDVDRPDVDRPDVDRPDVDRPDVDRPDGEQPQRDRATDPAELLDRAERGERGQRGQRDLRPSATPGRDRPGEAAEQSRGSFDFGPFRGRQRSADRLDDGRGRADADARSRAERGAGDTSDAVRDAIRQRTPQRSGVEQRRARQEGRAAGRVDANRPPPLLERGGARGQSGQPGATPRGDAGARSADPRQPGAEADRGTRTPARRPGAAAPGGDASPGAGTPGAGTPGAGTPGGGTTPGAGGNAGGEDDD